MGWTWQHATNFYKSGKINRRAELEKELNLNDYTVVDSAMIGTTYYGAIKRSSNNEVYAAVILTKTDMSDYFNFGYKDLDEYMKPCETKCPVKILKLLTPTENECANKWRKECWENARKPKLADIKVGQIIRANKGKYNERILVKRKPNHQFKTAWFQDLSALPTLAYFSKRHINNWEYEKDENNNIKTLE